MHTWQKPSFEELAMNAEIGAYQPEYDDGRQRDDVPFAKNAGIEPALEHHDA